MAIWLENIVSMTQKTQLSGNDTSENIFSKLIVHRIEIFYYLIEKNLKPETKKDSKVYVCRAHSFTEKKN